MNPYTLAASFLYRHHSQWAVPTSLGVALTSKCNLKCSYCMLRTFTPPEGEISPCDLEYILMRNPSISGVCIMGLCEPCLHPEFPEILQWLKTKKYSVSFTTNLTIHFTQQMLTALRSVDDMAVSIDSADPDTFRKLRTASLKNVMSNLDRLIRFKRSLGLKANDPPPIHVNAVITKANWAGIPQLIEMLEPYGNDLTYLMLDPCTRPDFSKENAFSLTEKPSDFEEIKAIAHKSKLKVMGFDWMFRKSTEWSSCHISWYGPFVHANGDVYPCYKYDYVLGNVYEQSLCRIWNSRKMREFRGQLRTNGPPLQQCHTCNFARPGWQPNGEYNIRHEDSE